LILLDTSGLLAALVADQRRHREAREALERSGPPFVLSPFVLAELDYLLTRESGTAAELALLGEVAAGAYDPVPFLAEDVGDAAAVIERYRDLDLGLADASIVTLAGRFRTERVLTLDERHFRVLRTPRGRPFTILPADS
jgi:hypothetical protein